MARVRGVPVTVLARRHDDSTAPVARVRVAPIHDVTITIPTMLGRDDHGAGPTTAGAGLDHDSTAGASGRWLDDDRAATWSDDDLGVGDLGREEGRRAEREREGHEGLRGGARDADHENLRGRRRGRRAIDSRARGSLMVPRKVGLAPAVEAVDFRVPATILAPVSAAPGGRAMKVAVVVFPGSNADWDALHVARDVMGWDARFVFHKETDLGDAELVILPGGFAHGDYLRTGAIARFSPISDAIVKHAERGAPVLGICNGFQILAEMGLVPGVLTRNAHLRFECRDVWVKVEGEGRFTKNLTRGTTLRLPIAHAEGRYHCDDDTLARLEGEGLVAVRYTAADGQPLRGNTVNGSRNEIAGIYNASRNVMGLMPHPERASEAILGNEDGRRIFEALLC